MKRYNENKITDLTLIYSVILGLLVFLVTFLITMPHKPSKEILENYATLTEQVMNQGISIQEIDYSKLDAGPDDIYIKIHPQKDETYIVNIKTPNVNIQFNFSEGKILNTSYIYWQVYACAAIISFAVSFISFFVFFFIVGAILFESNRKKA